MTNTLTLRYIPINEASLFNNNAKKHDLDAIAKSFKRYGFKSACKWESKLNDGDGGIVAGNGRIETLRMMFEQGDDAPDGIAIDSNGQWCVPVLFGVDAESEDIARAYAIDDNNLTLMCGEFTAVDLAKLYDADLLLSELEALSKVGELPVTVDDDGLEDLLKAIGGQEEENNNDDDYGEDDPTIPQSSSREVDTNFDELECTCPKCGFQFTKTK